MGEKRAFGLLQDVALIAVSSISMYYIAKGVVSSFPLGPDVEKEQIEQARLRAVSNLQRLDRSLNEDSGDESESSTSVPRRTRKLDLALDQYESRIAMEVVAPGDIPVGFDDIGGLEEIIEELKESVIYPLTMPHLYSQSSSLLSAPSGVLLYGPPGCGKTMLAKALAHESGACFINLHISTLTEKWYGDSNKLVRAVFSLARKLQPTIVFIDEIDAVLGQRRSGEHEASGMVKAEFMTLWDGLTSANESGLPARIMILGATNRIQDIDEAILRRMPKKFPVSLPNNSQRLRILSLILKGTKVDDKNFNINYLSKVMDGMSGSDIKEACRDAAMVPVREIIKEQMASGATIAAAHPKETRGIRTDDFFGRRGGQFIQDNYSKHSSEGPNKYSSSRNGREDVDELTEPTD